MWIAGAAAVVGAGATVYGAQQNKKAVAKAADSAATSVADTNALNYQRWLESQGVGPDGKPVNTKMPRWMTTAPGAFGTARVRPMVNVTGTSVPSIAALGPVASSLPAAPTAVPTQSFGSSNGWLAQRRANGTPFTAQAAPAASGGGMSNTSKAIALIDPGMALISNKRGGSALDPLGIF